MNLWHVLHENWQGLHALFSLVRKKVPKKYGTICTFFACTKKVPKKYTEGLRALLTPGNAVKLRLRFAPHVLRRYWKFHITRKRKNAQFFFSPLSDCGLTQAEFYEFFEFLLYWVLVLYLSFRAGIYGTKTGLFSRKIKFVIFDFLTAKVGAAHCRRKVLRERSERDALR